MSQRERNSYWIALLVTWAAVAAAGCEASLLRGPRDSSSSADRASVDANTAGDANTAEASPAADVSRVPEASGDHGQSPDRARDTARPPDHRPTHDRRPWKADGKPVTPDSAPPAGDQGGAGTLIKHYVTYYGWPDNDPPGTAIAYPKIHTGAGGVGTYADPITFATAPAEWPAGTILYVPYIKRYVIMEDLCASCASDWTSKKYHIDIWVNSNGTCDSEVIACENTLTASSTDVEVNPPSDRPVETQPLFDTGTCKCIK